MDDEQKKYSIDLNTEAQKLKKFTSISCLLQSMPYGIIASNYLHNMVN